MDPNLLKQALIGADKPLASNPLAEDTGRIEAVEALDEAISSDSVAWRVLLKAGCYAIAERAGLESEIDGNPRQVAAPVDVGRPMPSKIVEILLAILKEYQDQPQTPLHFLRKLDGKSLFFPAETLPRFLDIFSQRRMFKEDGCGTLNHLLGERGRWLAGKNSDWHWAAGGPVDTISADPAALEEIWNEGTFSERKNALKILAEHFPKAAKRLLAVTWKNDKAEHREAFLDILAETFDDSDVKFLETSLSDRSKNVRKIVAVCLARLPDCAFAQRARHRAEQIFVSGKTGKTLQIEPPKEFTQDMKADSFEEKPPQGVGEKAWWTAEILKIVPLVHWEKHFGRTPSQLLAALAKDDYFSSVLDAWTYSVQYYVNHPKRVSGLSEP